jgi:hypothetical protein
MEAVVGIGGSGGGLQRFAVSQHSKEMHEEDVVEDKCKDLRNECTNFGGVWLVIGPALDV